MQLVASAQVLLTYVKTASKNTVNVRDFVQGTVVQTGQNCGKVTARQYKEQAVDGGPGRA